jgi:hypothetical protein
MDKRLEEKFQSGLSFIVRGGTWLFAVWALVVIVPLTLWCAWAAHSGIADLILQLLFVLSFTWGVVALLQFQRSLRKLRLGPEGRTRLFSMKSPPDDPDELRAWRWGWQFMYAVLAVLLCMIAMPVLGHWTLMGF